ncbi:F-box protein interaction domain protein [Senna tora]|uniref:F-box protein interaction domain protein n=1 Tax=Senna tora TaxID=362788 RepID=A0A834WPQ7_9FABA|nr:F-box protein interaction domain protein [Senna tora]
MKRKRDSIATEVDDPEIQPLSPSFVDLPSPITTNILLRLPIKSVLICKCVCKSWHTIISDPHFAKLHFKDAPADVMIRTNDPKRVSRTLHLLKFQPKQFIGRSNYDNGSRFCICDDFVNQIVSITLSLRPNSSFLCGMLKWCLTKCLRPKMVVEKGLIACKPRDDKFDVLNSCKGLLCLCGPMDRNPLVVCIPVTGEFIRLPEGSKILRKAIDCGLDIMKTREYKVIRVFDSYARDPENAKNWLYNGRVAEMHTLGTGSWKNVDIGIVPYRLEFPTSLNGALHWLSPINYGYENWFHWPFGLYRPIKLFNKGSAVLMYHSCNFLIYHERRRHGFNFLKVRGTEFKFEAFAHIPSLISLKDDVKGDVEVQNVHSRCSAFKLREENDVLFLAEENVQQGRLYSSSEDDD